jgi:four helix bundle protein
MLNFEELEVYKKALDCIDGIYDAILKFPKEEQFGLVDQLRRASVSIAANIAEGNGRYEKKEYAQFLRIARSSTYECVALMQVSRRRGYVKEENYISSYSQMIEITKMLGCLINSLGE